MIALILAIGLSFFYHPIPPSHLEVPEEIAPILTGTFTYLGEGSQTIAYSSEDGQFVLKLFKATHQKSFKLKRFFRQADPLRSAQKWKEKFEATMRRTQLAFAHLKEESGLLFLHFQATPQPLPVILKERNGTLHSIPLHQLPFVVQKKAILVPQYLSMLIKQGKIEEAKQAVSALKQLFEIRALRGFSDPRQTLGTNYGFVEGQPIQIDIGKIENNPGADFSDIQEKVEAWAKKNFPVLNL